MGFPSTTTEELKLRWKCVLEIGWKKNLDYLRSKDSLVAFKETVDFQNPYLLKMKSKQCVESWSHYWFEVTIQVD